MKKVKKNKMFTIKDYDFNYCGVHIDYDRIYNCENEGCYNDMCRCGRIEDAHVIDVNIANIVAQYKVKGIDEYAVDRILRYNKIYIQNYWDVGVEGGYYGEEIKGVYLNPIIASKIDEQVSSVLFLKDDSLKIEELLRIEYGYLLDGLEGRTWTIEKINKNELIFGQDDYRKKLDKDAMAIYENYNLPRGIVIPKDDKYRLIDGYHRCSAGKDNFKVIVGRK